MAEFVCAEKKSINQRTLALFVNLGVFCEPDVSWCMSAADPSCGILGKGSMK